MEIKATNFSTTFESKATAEQKYDLTATAVYESDHKVKNINGGAVRFGQKQVANYSRYSADQMNITYTGALSTEEKQEITAVIDEFIATIEEKIKNI